MERTNAQLHTGAESVTSGSVSTAAPRKQSASRYKINSLWSSSGYPTIPSVATEALTAEYKGGGGRRGEREGGREGGGERGREGEREWGREGGRERGEEGGWGGRRGKAREGGTKEKQVGVTHIRAQRTHGCRNVVTLARIR